MELQQLRAPSRASRNPRDLWIRGSTWRPRSNAPRRKPNGTAVPEPEEESARPKPRPGTGKVLRGRVEFVGPGREFGTTLDKRDRRTNYVTLGFECFGRTYPEVVELSFDTFECVVPYADEDIERVRVLRASAQGGHWLPATGSETFAHEFDAPVVVRLMRAPPTRFKVVDARSGEMLDRFNVSPLDRSARTRGVASFEKGPVTTERLPFESGPEGLLRLRVSAEGWASRAVEFDLDAGGTHEIRMHRGGSVRVRWTVPDELSGALCRSLDRPLLHMRLHRVRALTSAQAASGEDELNAGLFVSSAIQQDSKPGESASVSATLKGVAPGEYRAVLEVPEGGFTKVRELAMARAMVRAGESTEVELTTLPELDYPAPERTFDVLVPSDYGSIDALHVLLQPATPKDGLDLDGSRRLLAREIEPRVWRSAPTRADAGSYIVTLSIDPMSAVPLEITERSDAPIRVVIPTPYRYRIRLQSQASEVPPKPRSMNWRSGSSVDSPSGERVDGSRGVFEIITGCREIEVSLGASCSTRLARGEWVQVKGGGEHFLDAVPGPCVRLVLHENGEPYDVDAFFGMVRARGPNGRRRPLDTRRVQSFPGSAHELLVWFREPGEYELEFNSISGFESLAPLKLTVSEGPERIVHIDLVRKR
jgi:hypothetical protein